MVTRTASERREERRQAYDVYLKECPARHLLDRISDKWVSLILVALSNGPRRYSELNHTIAGVSQKMLTQTLRSLERDGLITREVTAEVPVRVDYDLTPLGHKLMPVMAAIKSWAEENIEDVLASRERYDRSRPDDQDTD